MRKRGRVTPDSPGREQEAWEGSASLGGAQKPHRWSNPRSAELLSGDPRPHRRGDPTGAVTPQGPRGGSHAGSLSCFCL